VRLSAREKELRISIQAAQPVGAVYGDESRLMQIFWNLLANAVKFTPRGGTIDVHVEPHGDDVVVTVRDSGAGISADFLPHVFERFRQESGGTTAGLGIGLSIVRHL